MAESAAPTLPRFLVLLRRWHARVGLMGAAFGLMWGITGITLNHRSVMKLETGHVEERAVQIELAAPAATPEALGQDLAARLGYGADRVHTRVRPARPASFGGAPVKAAEQWVVNLEGHARFAQALYLPGNRTVDLKQMDASFLETLKRLHKSEAGQPAWILFADAFAGVVIFMSLSGTLLWTRLAGPRLLAAALAGGAVLTGLIVALQGW